MEPKYWQGFAPLAMGPVRSRMGQSKAKAGSSTALYHVFGFFIKKVLSHFFGLEPLDFFFNSPSCYIPATYYELRSAQKPNLVIICLHSNKKKIKKKEVGEVRYR
jgi:hypothetical protein